MFISISDLRAYASLRVVMNLAFDVILGTCLIQRYIQAQLPSESKVVPWHSSPVWLLFSSSIASPLFSIALVSSVQSAKDAKTSVINED